MCGNQRQDNFKQDSGMVLPLVVIVVITLALWTGAVLLLTRSTGATITQNIEQATLRQDLVRAAIESVIPQLTPKDILGPDGYVATDRLLGIGSDYDTSRTQSCANKTFAPVQFTSASGVKHQVSVLCAEATESGAQSPPATFLLVGTGKEPQSIGGTNSQSCILIKACTTGKDGGIRVDGTVSSPTQVSGGLVNLSGAWIGVSNQTISLRRPATSKVYPNITSPRIILNSSGSPLSDVEVQCPAATGGFDVSSCDCPTVASDTDNPNPCLVGDDRPTLSTIRIQSPSSGVGNYLRSMTKQVLRETEPDFGGFFNAQAIIPIDCTSPVNNASTGNYWAVIVDSRQGSLIGINQLRQLNNLTGSTGACIGNGSTKAAPLLLMRGIFRFVLDSGVIRSTSNTNPNTWLIKNNKSIVIGGTPLAGGASGAEKCQPVIAQSTADRIGVQLQMTGASYIDVEAGTLSLCPFEGAGGSGVAIVALDEYLSSYTPSTKKIDPWRGFRNFSAGNDEPYMIRTNLGSGGGSAPILNVNGLVLAPGASAYLALQASSLTTFERGGVFRALTIRQNSSATASAALNPPRAANGDRLVQLRFWDSILGDLGVVQLYIRDDFGVRPGYAYSYTVWRTMW